MFYILLLIKIVFSVKLYNMETRGEKRLCTSAVAMNMNRTGKTIRAEFLVRDPVKGG